MSTYNGNNNSNIINGDNAAPFKVNGNGGLKDTIHGKDGNDIIHGLTDNDFLYGDDNNDTLYGDAGNDYLSGGDGNDHLYGGIGIDTLEGGKGKNHLTGGAGGGNGIAGAPGDIYNLTTGKTNPDTIHIDKGDSPFQLVGVFGALGPKAPTGFDRVFKFDKYDTLDLPSAKIMNDTDGNGSAHGNGNGIINGVDVGVFSKHSVEDGIIKLYNTQDNYVSIDTVLKAGDAYKYLLKNCLPVNLDKVGALLVNITANLPGQPSGPHTVVFQDHTGPTITAIDIVGDVTGFITDGQHCN